MARPIKMTPPIEGEDAKRFRTNLIKNIVERNTHEGKRKHNEERKKMERSYNLMMAISGGKF